jgi:hypothetical protein
MKDSAGTLANRLLGLVFAGLAGPLVAQAPEPKADAPAARAKQLVAVAAQMVEADTRAALGEAAKLTKSDPAEAVRRLKAAVAALESDAALPESRRAVLTRVVRDRLRVAELAPAPSDQPIDAAASRTAADAARIAEEQKAVRTGLEEVARLRKQGKGADADRAFAKLTQAYPDNLALQLLATASAASEAVKSDTKQRKDNESAIVANLREVDQSAVMGTQDMEFPADWHARTGKRRDLTAPSPEEVRVMRALATAVDARYKDSRFQDVIDHLATSMNRTIIVDAAALTEAGIGYDTPVNFAAREPLAARTALRAILANYNLAYVVRDGIIHVTLPGKARDLMTTRVYYLGDLITGLGPYGGAPTVGAALDQVQLAQNIAAIVEMITSAIDPLSWDKRGGQGNIGVNLPTLSLTVRQSQEVHGQLRAGLYGRPMPPLRQVP